MARPQHKNAVVVYDAAQQPTPPVTQVQVIQDPGTGRQVQVIYDPNAGQYIPVQMPTAPAMDSRGDFLDNNAIGTHSRRRVRVVQHPDGTRAYEIDEDVAEVKHRTVSDETQRAMYGGAAVPQALSKKRLFIGGLLALLLIMVMADIAGVPHVRTGEGRYASLEGVKAIDTPDAPAVILKRLDRSVFLYTLDGIGWVFSTLGGADNTPAAD